jgi:large subunit ribosomal protein L15
MKLNEMKPNEGSIKKRMRVGRGHSSGMGKTCGSGTKGQKSRTGVAINGFEGGQMPLFRRLPKQGFTNIFAKKLGTASLGQIQAAIDAGKLDGKATIDEDALVKAGVVRRKADGIRILGTGELKAKISLNVTGITAGAKAALEKAGGKVDLIVREVKPVVRKKAKVNG